MSQQILISRLAMVSSSVLLVLAVHAVLQRPCKLYVPPKERVDQGCIHQGNDRRLAAPVVCWLQRYRCYSPDFARYQLGKLTG